jgi:hypothetical protein
VLVLANVKVRYDVCYAIYLIFLDQWSHTLLSEII